ncbi:GGDEF domain-containing protein [Candidatus Woesearchaeota archaeon]|nr:GGDEF domain-containing protein [Candidatus Woesearchaeota archaeon]MBT6518686.1 GGDEF domain-containing protein [Candidatus Woesearchaeota archaeon]MBT7368875.1 GGDEF domain-containing protein [Candidatus Woesearchaeota archaeon]
MFRLESILEIVEGNLVDQAKKGEINSLLDDLDKKLGNGGKTKQVLEFMFNLYKEVINSVDDLIILYDSKGDIIKVNNVCKQFTGYTKDELKHLNLEQLIPADLNPDFKKGIIERFTEQSKINFPDQDYFLANLVKKEHEDSTTSSLFFEVNIKKIAEGLNDNGLYVLCGRDVTKRKKLELQLKQKNDQLKKLNEKLEQVSITDELTGLYNRRYFEQRFSQERKRISRTKGFFSVMMLDFDNFKPVNDQLGHKVGDYVLKKVSAVLEENLRNYTMICRWGGDEFAALLSRTSVDEAKQIGQRVVDSIQSIDLRFDELPIPDKRFKETYVLAKKYNLVYGPNLEFLKIGVSVGVGSTHNSDPLTIFDDVDSAMYAAKDAGRNRVVAYQLKN